MAGYCSESIANDPLSLLATRDFSSNGVSLFRYGFSEMFFDSIAIRHFAKLEWVNAIGKGSQVNRGIFRFENLVAISVDLLNHCSRASEARNWIRSLRSEFQRRIR